jgi:hypothetical protein
MFIYVFIILIYNFIYFALAYYKIAVRSRTYLKIRFAHDTHVLGNVVGYCVGLPNRSKFVGGAIRYIVVVGFIHGHHLQRHTPFSVILRLNDSAKSMSSAFPQRRTYFMDKLVVLYFNRRIIIRNQIYNRVVQQHNLYIVLEHHTLKSIDSSSTSKSVSNSSTTIVSSQNLMKFSI